MSVQPEDLLNPQLLTLPGYKSAPAVSEIKLDAMENPWGMPAELRAMWAQNLAACKINRYPDAAMTQMDQAMRELLNIPASLATLYGNGSDELIQLLLLGLRRDGGGILTPEPSFVMYQHLSACCNLPYHGVPLMVDFQLDVSALCTTAKKTRAAIIFIASPNNPTGNSYTAEQIIPVIEQAYGLVVIDEAYYPYSNNTLVHLVDKYPHLLILRTLSKLGLAGLRIGVLIGNPLWIKILNKLRLPYNIGSLSQASVQFINQHPSWLQEQVSRLIAAREILYHRLLEIDHIQVWQSSANFLLFKVLKKSSDQIYNGLLSAGILIKNMHRAHPQLHNCLRVTIGNEHENEKFLQTLTQLLH